MFLNCLVGNRNEYVFLSLIPRHLRSSKCEFARSVTAEDNGGSSSGGHEKPSPPWRIMFFGSDNFATKSLDALCSKYRTNTIISKLDVSTNASCLDWKKKHNHVYEYAKQEKLNIFNWPIDHHDVEYLVKKKYDLGVVVSFGFLIPETIIALFPLGILNVHASLLPRWRGAAPVIHAIWNGDTETGITVIRIHPKKFDTGDIVKQYSVPIKPDETAAQLTSRLALIGGRLLVDCIRDLPRCVELAIPQTNSGSGVCYAKKITPSMASIDWCSKSAHQIHNQYRALSHIFPLTTYWFGSLVKIADEIKVDQIVGMNPENRANLARRSLAVAEAEVELTIPGLVEFSRRRSVLRVQCTDGKWITLRKVIFQKKVLTAADFYNGYISKVKNSLHRKFVTVV